MLTRRVRRLSLESEYKTDYQIKSMYDEGVREITEKSMKGSPKKDIENVIKLTDTNNRKQMIDAILEMEVELNRIL